MRDRITTIVILSESYSVTLHWKSIASTSIVETCQKYGHDIGLCRENWKWK